MDKHALLARLREASAWNKQDMKLLSDLPYFNGLLNAAKDLGEEDYESGANAKFPREFGSFCQMLSRFVESNFGVYIMPDTTLTGMAPDGGEDGF
jgi:hypothetical protein